MDVNGRTCVITGASRGLGAGMAAEMARLGVRLGLCARSPVALPDGDDVVSACLDVTDPAALEVFAARVGQKLGRIDLWINNAAVLEPVGFQRDLTPEQLRDHLEINVIGVLNGTRAYLDHLRAHPGEGGVLLNISSGAAQHGYAAWSAYCAGKAAVDRMSECLQLEEEQSGLRVHAVAPGVIDTDMQKTIRGLTKEQFPMIEKFHEFKEKDLFNSPEYVARELLAIAFDPARRPEDVVTRVEYERR